MAIGYTRQSAGGIITAATITAALFNNEYDQLASAFNASTGHNHDGTVGGGAAIPLGGNAVTGTLPLTKGGTGEITKAAAQLSLGVPFTQVAGATSVFTVATSQEGTVFDCDTSSGGFTVTLPVAATAGDGFTVGFKKTSSDANTLVIDGDGSEEIDGATTATLENQNEAIYLICDGTGWLITNVKTVSASLTIPVTIADGGTGTTTAAGARSAFNVPEIPVAISEGGTGSTSESTARTALGVAIGSDVQAYDADLTTLAAIGTNGLLTRTGSGTYSPRTISGTSNEIEVTNGDGVSGNPTIGLPSSISISGDIISTGGNLTANAGQSASSPAFNFDTDLDTGMLSSGANEIGWAVGGVQRMTLRSDGDLSIGGFYEASAGTASGPAFRFGSDNNTGIYRKDTDQLAFSTGGTLAAFIDASQHFTVGSGTAVTAADTTGDGVSLRADGQVVVKRNSGDILVVNYTGPGGGTEDLISFRHDGSEIGKVQKDAGNTSVSYTTTSDVSKKQNIEDITMHETRKVIKSLKPRNFKWKTNVKELGQNAVLVSGFIAQEVEEVVPLAVSGEDGDKTLSVGKFDPFIIKALQDLYMRLEKVENK